MCLGDLAEVLAVTEGVTAEVRTDHRLTSVSLLTLDLPVAPGDWLLVHSGYALRRLSQAEADEAARIRATPQEESR
jgi:hydrogenase expression/formation protein HypC